MTTSDAPMSTTAESFDISGLGDELLRLQRRRRHVYDGTVLENSAFRLLWVLDDGQPRTLRQLSQDLDLEQSTVNRQVNAALAAGWLERLAAPDAGGAGGARLHRPTEAGAAAYRHDGLVRATTIRAALAELGPERAASVIAGLRALNDAWDAVIARDDGGGAPS